jgi:glycosyltransferase involved in cell wall biosynthesis
LVYIEALSQGLPVLYTKNQGIDGLFDESIGVSVNALSVNSIKEGLSQLLEHREKYSNKHVDFELFRWNIIAKKYKSLYEQLQTI